MGSRIRFSIFILIQLSLMTAERKLSTCRWTSEKIPIIGFVLTGTPSICSRCDCSLWHEYDLLILKGSEVETNTDMVTAFLVSQDLCKLELRSRIFQACRAINTGAIASRSTNEAKVGMFAHTDRLGLPEG